VPENAPGSAQVYQDPTPSSKNDFHAEATDEQRFHVHLDFGRVFESQGNVDRAVLEYQEALTVVETPRRRPFRSADQALAHRRMAGALDRLGRFAQAEVHYKKALKLSPKDPKVWNDAGYSYYLQGRWADAERALKTAAKLAPDDERIKLNLGLALAAAGRSDEAFPLLSLSNGDAIGHSNLGYLLASTGQFDLARRQYETALAMRPDLELARRALTRLDRQERQLPNPEATPEMMAKHVPATAPSVDLSVHPTSTADAAIPPPRRISAPLPDPNGAAPPLPISTVGSPTPGPESPAATLSSPTPGRGSSAPEQPASSSPNALP